MAILAGVGIEQRSEAITHGLRKKLLPTLKSTRREGGRLAEGREKAF
jgi:hypothetical protein